MAKILRKNGFSLREIGRFVGWKSPRSVQLALREATIMSHTCHVTGCPTRVPPEMWGCKKHWFMVPKSIRDRIWRSYRVGQCDDMNPSKEYCEAARDAVIAVAKKEAREPDTRLYDLFLRRENASSAPATLNVCSTKEE
jgi:hypothetical protein